MGSGGSVAPQMGITSVEWATTAVTIAHQEWVSASTTKSDRKGNARLALSFKTWEGQSVHVEGLSPHIESLIAVLSPLVDEGKILQGFTWKLHTHGGPGGREVPWREPLNFYNTRGPYGCFTNFSRYAVVQEEKSWPTSEHYFQAMKHRDMDEDYVEQIRLAPHPGEAARMGRDRSHAIREDWDDIRDDVMRWVVLVKFSAHTDCMATLMGTGGAELVEHTTRDSYWGDGGDGSGKNMLGKILMEVRDVLRGQIQHRTLCLEGLSPVTLYKKSLHIPWWTA